MSRDNMVRLSDGEREALEELRRSKFSSDTPFGRVIGSMANQEVLAEQKKILITGKGRAAQYPDSDMNFPRARVMCRPVGDDGSNLRGYSADLIILLTDVPDNIRTNVLSPMGAELIELY